MKRNSETSGIKLLEMLDAYACYIEHLPTPELNFLFCSYPDCHDILNDIRDELIMRGELERMDSAMVTNQGTYEHERGYLDRRKYDPDFEDDNQYCSIEDNVLKDLMEGDLEHDREEFELNEPYFP